MHTTIAPAPSASFSVIAERFRRAGQADRAVELCREGLALYPDHLSARVTLGCALLDLGQDLEAHKELQAVLKRAPDNLAAIRGLAELHARGVEGQDAQDAQDAQVAQEVLDAQEAQDALDAEVALEAQLAQDAQVALHAEVAPEAEAQNALGEQAALDAQVGLAPQVAPAPQIAAGEQVAAAPQIAADEQVAAAPEAVVDAQVMPQEQVAQVAETAREAALPPLGELDDLQALGFAAPAQFEELQFEIEDVIGPADDVTPTRELRSRLGQNLDPELDPCLDPELDPCLDPELDPVMDSESELDPYLEPQPMSASSVEPAPERSAGAIAVLDVWLIRIRARRSELLSEYAAS